MARLSTHVLDTAHGTPASNLVIDLHSHGQHIVTMATTYDGRTPDPLLSGDTIEPGVYELTFHAGDYFRARGVPLSDPAFLDLMADVVLRTWRRYEGARPLTIAPPLVPTAEGRPGRR